MYNLVSLTQNKDTWPLHFLRFCHGVTIFGTQLQKTELRRAICIFTNKTDSRFFLTESLFCIRALYKQNSLPRIHSSLLQLIAAYSFTNLDTATPLASFLAKRNLRISLSFELFCWQSCLQYIRLCTCKKGMGWLRAGKVICNFSSEETFCLHDNN